MSGPTDNPRIEAPQVENPRAAVKVTRIHKLEDASVALNEAQRLTVEFRIQDLVRRLVPDGDLASNCGGCNGCMGCSM